MKFPATRWVHQLLASVTTVQEALAVLETHGAWPVCPATRYFGPSRIPGSVDDLKRFASMSSRKIQSIESMAVEAMYHYSFLNVGGMVLPDTEHPCIVWEFTESDRLDILPMDPIRQIEKIGVQVIGCGKHAIRLCVAPDL